MATSWPVDELASLLWSLPQFRQLDRADLVMLCEDAEVVEFAPEAEVFRQGESGDTALLVLSGKLVVAVESAERDVVVGQCQPGEIIGESALLGREPVHNATARAVEPCKGLVITQRRLISPGEEPSTDGASTEELTRGELGAISDTYEGWRP